MSDEEVLKKFYDDCLLRGLSERTKESYLRTINEFLAFSGKSELSALTGDDLRRWLLHLRAEGRLTTATTNQYNSACKFLLRNVLDVEVKDSQTPNARLKRKVQPYMSVDEVKEFFSHFNDILVFTYFLLLYSTGMRRFEALNVTPEDIHGSEDNPNDDYIIVRRGKGGHDRRVALPHPTYLMLREFYSVWWLPKYRTMGVNEKTGIKKTPLFPSVINGVKAQSFLSKAFNDVRDCNTSFAEFHPHTLRHAFAVHMLQKDINNLFCVKANFGHKSLASTEIYLGDAILYGVSSPETPAEVAAFLCDAFHDRQRV